jgi:hypothetical protein
MIASLDSVAARGQTEPLDRARKRASGPVLFARYAFGPNRLGLCGPQDWRALLELGAAGADDRGLRELARGFEGAWPYLELVATASGITDPLDRRVVEGYWLGTGLADAVGPGLIGRSLEDRFRDRVAGDGWRWLATKPEAGARPVHAFHVLDILPTVGLMRDGRVDDVLRVMDSCRIRWGRVLEARDDELVVASPRLELVGGRLRLGAATLETARRSLDGVGFLADVRPGDVVSLHWDWACDRLDAGQLRALVRSTRRQVAIANQTI